MNKIIHFIIFFIGLFSCMLGTLFYFVQHQQVDFSVLQHYNPGKPSIVLDDEGHEWARFALDRREPINFQEIPEHLIQAFISAEDHYFWSHRGVSFRGIFRSLLINCYHGKIVQGASTITQQLVKLLFFDARRTYGRKFKEQFYALLVERQFSKEHILQTYLNHVYFGCGIYGVEAAAQRFWSKHARDLTLEESAMLAGVVKSPGQYCPLLYPLSTKKRRDVVLHSMKALGFITDEHFELAKAQPLNIVSNLADTLAPHAKETVRIFLENLVGKNILYTGGFIVQTTLNHSMQWHAQKAFEQQVRVLKKSIASQVDGALVCMETKTGEIKALIGGADFSESQFNRALQAKRQFGSIFKPFVYAAAIDKGMHFAQTAIDEPFAMGQEGHEWAPRNSARQFEGEMTLARALSNSNNIITIKTLLAVGIDRLVNLAEKLRLSDNIPYYPSLALGCLDGTLREATAMFNVWANNGVYIEPHFIKWIKDSWGTKIWKKKIDTERILSHNVTSQVSKVLSIGLSRIKNRYPNNWINADAIGKTGTTNDCRTNWFCGSTPNYTTALYIGLDDNRSMGKHIYAAQTVFPIWLELHKHLPAPQKKFIYDPNLKEVLVDSITGKITANKQNSRVFSLLIPDNYL